MLLNLLPLSEGAGGDLPATLFKYLIWVVYFFSKCVYCFT